MSKRMELFWGFFLNISFVILILLVKYFFDEKKIHELWVDSDRQEVKIDDNTSKIDSTKLIVDENSKDIDEIAELTADQYNKLKKLNELQKSAERQLSEIQFKIDSLRGLSADLVIPFEKEFGNQDNYIRVFVRTGLEVEDNLVMNSATDLGFDGQIKLGEPIIEQIGKSEFKAIVPSQEFEGLKLVGSESLPVRMKIPRNQISIGPMLGVTYDKITGLTEPIYGFGVTYNLIKVADWR